MKKYFVIFLVLAMASAAAAAGEKVEYKVNDQPYEGYYVSPAPNAPLVVIIHDWDGLTDYEVKRAGMLADMGYAAFAADLFGAGIRPAEIEEKKQRTGELYKDRAKMRALIQGALDAAESKGGNVKNAVIIGYCFGGTAVLEFARSGADIKGFVSFHGGLESPKGQNYSETKGKVLVLHGSADKFVTLDQFAELAESLEKNGISHEMITYSGAPHAFTVFGSKRYREDADKKSWERFKGFLAETLH